MLQAVNSEGDDRWSSTCVQQYAKYIFRVKGDTSPIHKICLAFHTKLNQFTHLPLKINRLSCYFHKKDSDKEK